MPKNIQPTTQESSRNLYHHGKKIDRRPDGGVDEVDLKVVAKSREPPAEGRQVVV